MEDLQAQMEAGAHQLDGIADRTNDIRNQLLARQLEQANIARTLVRRITELQKSIYQQLETLAELQRTIRNRK